MGVATTVVGGGSGRLSGVEFELANVEDCSQNLAHAGDFLARKLELAECSLEVLKALCIVDADFELGWMAQVTPPLLRTQGVSVADTSGQTMEIEAQMVPFRGTGASQKIVQDVEVSFSWRDSCHSTPLKSVVEQLTADQGWLERSRRLILQFEEKTSFRCSRGSDGLCGGEGVEDKGGIRELVREGCRGVVEERRQKMGANGSFTCTAFSPVMMTIVVSMLYAELCIAFDEAAE